MVADLSLGSRLLAIFLIPVSVLLTVFGPQIGTALFGLRSANLDGAAQLGAALAVSAFGLLPFAITMLQMRVFYALTDSRTPTLVQLVTVAVKIPLLLACRGAAAGPGRRARPGRGEQRVVRGRRGARAAAAAPPARPDAHRAGAGHGRCARWSRRWLAGLLASAAVRLAGRAAAGLAPAARAWTALVLAFLVLGPAHVLGMRVLRVRGDEPFPVGSNGSSTG